MDTQTVLDRHLAAFGTGDTEEVLKDYTEDSVLLTPEATVKGLQGIRAVFDEFFAGMFKPGTYEFGMDGVQVAGEVALIAWHATCSAVHLPHAVDTFVIRDGKIVAQTFAAKVDPTG